MKTILVFASLIATLTALSAAPLTWSTDLSATLAKAKESKKLVLANFTGSDWCSWCIKLKKEIFDQKEFATYAEKNLLLVEIDFPRKKAQTVEVKKANRVLSEKYAIEGFPTVVILNSEGKELGKLGYMESGPKGFIAEVEKLRK
ncbi:MAG TPA: thioredoxin family protein [Candidatus Paceibacterota bacterium]|nr:thioredoxin family protein [Candidatus Paceibacterota bacterium]HRZ99809.1 thioredoxin family protein [Candidatus Paceibacterota bacterium]